MDWRAIGPLAAYINRVGAEQLNFRKFIVRVYTGNYYTERSTIILAADGTITCNNSEYAPTEEEQDAIKAAFLSNNYTVPTWVKASPQQLPALRALIGNSDPLYEFYDRGTDTVIMVQQRAMRADGRKKYVPWSYWSDNLWRAMEPDRALPLWKPRFSTNKRRIMMHEGAKPAAHMHDLCTNPMRQPELDCHPWRDEIVDCEHWGVIGGAQAPQRTDYDDILVERPLELIYVCDNDFSGRAALQVVSKHVNYPLRGVVFDDNWPRSWDMADPMPRSMYGARGRWTGEPLRHYMKPATWATTQRKAGNKTITTIRSDFAEEWSSCIEPDVYVHNEWSNRIYGPKEFNKLCSPYSHVEDTATLFHRCDASKTAVLRYVPSLPLGVYTTGDGRYINTHKPSNIVSERGDVRPFLRFMKHLIPPQSDRTHALKWIATLIARPDIKMHYGMLLISETQGVGKGTLGERVLGPIIGEHNVSSPSEHEICESPFNYWSAHKRLAVVHEIYAGHSAKAYNRLKSVITDKTITVNKKYQADYQIDNWLHIFACSNSKKALKLDDNDRRWLVPLISDDKRSPAYWQEFNHWLAMEGGLSFIKAWAKAYVTGKRGPVMMGDPAPWTLAKQEVVREGWSVGQNWTAEFLDQAKTKIVDMGVGAFMLDIDLVEGIKQMIYDGRHSSFLERPATIRKVAESCGWHVGTDYVRVEAWNPRGARAKIIGSTPELGSMTRLDQANGLRKLDVVAQARQWANTAETPL